MTDSPRPFSGTIPSSDAPSLSLAGPHRSGELEMVPHRWSKGGTRPSKGPKHGLNGLHTRCATALVQESSACVRAPPARPQLPPAPLRRGSRPPLFVPPPPTAAAPVRLLSAVRSVFCPCSPSLHLSVHREIRFHPARAKNMRRLLCPPSLQPIVSEK